MSLVGHFSRVWTFIFIKLGSGSGTVEGRIRIRIKVTSRIRIRICIKGTSRMRIRIKVMRICNTGCRIGQIVCFSGFRLIFFCYYCRVWKGQTTTLKR